MSAAQSVALDVNQNKSMVGRWQILSWGAQEQQRKEGGMSVIKRLQEAGKVPAGCRGGFHRNGSSSAIRAVGMSCATFLVRRIRAMS